MMAIRSSVETAILYQDLYNPGKNYIIPASQQPQPVQFPFTASALSTDFLIQPQFFLG
jgi:hypothetical protein